MGAKTSRNLKSINEDPGHRSQYLITSCLGSFPFTNLECNQFRYNNNRVHTDIKKNMPEHAYHRDNSANTTVTQHEKDPTPTNNASIRILRDSNYEVGGKEENEHGDQRAANTMKEEARCLSDLNHHHPPAASGIRMGCWPPNYLL